MAVSKRGGTKTTGFVKLLIDVIKEPIPKAVSVPSQTTPEEQPPPVFITTDPVFPPQLPFVME